MLAAPAMAPPALLPRPRRPSRSLQLTLAGSERREERRGDGEEPASAGRGGLAAAQKVNAGVGAAVVEVGAMVVVVQGEEGVRSVRR